MRAPLLMMVPCEVYPVCSHSLLIHHLSTGMEMTPHFDTLLSAATESSSAAESHINDSNSHAIEHTALPDDSLSVSRRQACIFIVALSVHSVFEGTIDKFANRALHTETESCSIRRFGGRRRQQGW